MAKGTIGGRNWTQKHAVRWCLSDFFFFALYSYSLVCVEVQLKKGDEQQMEQALQGEQAWTEAFVGI